MNCWIDQPGRLLIGRLRNNLTYNRPLSLPRYPLDPDEVVTCIEVMSLEVSEVTRQRRDMAVVGTAILRGEDLNAQGAIYVFDVLDVVPEPDRPETGRRLELFAKVKEKGAVTAITQIGSEGFLLAAQGQKCLVRGLKEDHSLQPVAFIDVQCYSTVVKELQGTGLSLIADGVKGLWLTGYTVRWYLDPWSNDSNAGTGRAIQPQTVWQRPERHIDSGCRVPTRWTCTANFSRRSGRRHPCASVRSTQYVDNLHAQTK